MNVPPHNMIDQLSLNEIVQHCRDETDKYRRHLENMSDYCFELFRRALRDHSIDAVTHIFRVYESLLLSWVTRHPQYHLVGEEPDHFVSVAFSNFYFALRGERFSNFNSLQQILAYLKRCVHTSISMYLRGTTHTDGALLDSSMVSSNHNLEDNFHLYDIWERINLLLPDEADRLLANSVFAHHLKPSQVVGLFPYWGTARDVSVDLQRIRRILRGDNQLRKLLGIETHSD